MIREKISIIVPFYNGNQYLENLFQCIRSNALNTDILDFELILVNDSPDVIVKYDKDWVKGYNLKVINNKKNFGIHKSRINGLKESKGQFIIFLDQDDYLESDAISSQYNKISDSDIVVGNGFDENLYSYGSIYRSFRQQMLVKKSIFYYAIGSMIVSPGQCLIRKTAIPETWCNTILNENGADDLLLWLLMLKEDLKWEINFTQVYYHIDTGENLSRDNRKMNESSLVVLTLLKKYGLISNKSEYLFKRRLSMKRLYFGKNKFMKLLAFLSYPDISSFLLIKKLL